MKSTTPQSLPDGDSASAGMSVSTAAVRNDSSAGVSAGAALPRSSMASTMRRMPAISRRGLAPLRFTTRALLGLSAAYLRLVLDRGRVVAHHALRDITRQL